MKNVSLFIYLILLSCANQTTTEKSVALKEEEIGTPQIITEPFPEAEFPGGLQELFCFIDKNLNKSLHVSIKENGTTVTQFKIDTIGNISDIKTLKSLDKDLDEELRRIVSIMPKWIPAKQGKKAIEVTLNLPLKWPYENKCDR